MFFSIVLSSDFVMTAKECVAVSIKFCPSMNPIIQLLYAGPEAVFGFKEIGLKLDVTTWS